MNPYKHVWIVLWAEQDTQRSGVHGVFTDVDAARDQAAKLNHTMGRVYRVEQWPIL